MPTSPERHFAVNRQQAPSNVTFTLEPPSGAPFAGASGNAKIDGQFLSGGHPVFGAAQGLRLQLSGLPCRCYVPGSESREFYVAYLETSPSTPPLRLMSFNTSFLSNVETALVMPVPVSVPLFLEPVTVTVYLETDDGGDGPDGSGLLVLRGSVIP